MGVISKKVYKARKQYVCDKCGGYINKNVHHLYSFVKEDKKTKGIRTHLECSK